MKATKSSTLTMIHPSYAKAMALRTAYMMVLSIIWVLMAMSPCMGADSAENVEPAFKTRGELASIKNEPIPQWSWDWVEDLREQSAALIPVPVTLNHGMSLGNPTSMVSSRSVLNQHAGAIEHRSLFSVLDDGEALLALLDRSQHENRVGLESMLANTLNTSFLSMGSRLEFHVGKRFLPYLGGGIIYGGKDSGSGFFEGVPSTTGWELGVGFTFSEAPLRFGVDALYRGLDIDQEDRGIAMRMDEACPSNFDKDEYSLSIGFTVHY